MSVLMKVEALSKSFYKSGNEVKIFTDASFHLKKGEITVIKGRSGEGKSTLISILSGLERPTAGKVYFQDQEITNMSLSQLAEIRAKSIGIIFQNFNLIQSWTSLENVEAVLMHRGISPAIRKEKAAAILTKLGLEKRLDNLPGELSIGQQQRVAIARTLVNEPALILADEPTGDVDPETAEEISELLIPMVKENEASLIVATHGTFNSRHANRTLTLHKGELKEFTNFGGEKVV